MGNSGFEDNGLTVWEFAGTPDALTSLESAIENYLFALKHLNDYSHSKNIQLVFVYYPSYSQIYDLKTSMLMRDILQETTQQLSIPFLDLPPQFRQIGQNQVLHLAPTDFHPNSDGNKLIAETIAEFLLDEQFLVTP